MHHSLFSKPLALIWAAIIIACGIILFRRDLFVASDAAHRYVASITKAPAAPFPQAAPSLVSLDTIQNRTLGFEKIFVVSLPSRTDRRDGMVLQAGLSDMAIEFIDGLQNSQISEPSIPKADDGSFLQDQGLGAWRAHMNAIQEVVRRNLSTAFIMEDDGDWDIRFKGQLQHVAQATRALVQPLASDSTSYADATFPRRPHGHAPVPDIMFDSLPETLPPQHSPYGDGWDVLWIGHCGQSFPKDDNQVLSRGRVIQNNDSTVPKKQHLESPFNQPFTLSDDYPDHTRAVHHSQQGICSAGYGVTQSGARQLLLELGLKEVTQPFDLLLRRFCDGTAGRGKHTCITTQPSLINVHRPRGHLASESDIGNAAEGFRAVGETKMIRISTRLNAAALLYGEEPKDQYPDE
ncbi:hypothetical protein CDD82_7629 [Ophiocordyceps australis]|uniref:Glycosyl transferase family 25 domain-containing protein n=1 Tax=Ophiocordyceps australis TaxID=1399860 RepID=A0A2C5YQ33_9HYPO|nr:hypothetical protein CDD82_7629 [Ophiocordyceps australis]